MDKGYHGLAYVGLDYYIKFPIFDKSHIITDEMAGMVIERISCREKGKYDEADKIRRKLKKEGLWMRDGSYETGGKKLYFVHRII